MRTPLQIRFSVRPAPVLAALLWGGLALACGSGPSGPVPVAAPPPAPPPTARPAPTAASDNDPWCAERVLEFGTMRRGRRLQEVMAETPVVTIAVSTFDKVDCSGTGRLHLVYSRWAEHPPAGDAAPLVEAYAAQDMALPAPPKAAYYLLGARPTEPEKKDLSRVCLPTLGPVNARALWVLALVDLDAAQRWSRRLRDGLCGRNPT